MSKVRVFPHPDLAERNEYLPGIGAAGALVSEEEAADLLERGLVVEDKKPKKPAAPSAVESAEPA